LEDRALPQWENWWDSFLLIMVSVPSICALYTSFVWGVEDGRISCGTNWQRIQNFSNNSTQHHHHLWGSAAGEQNLVSYIDQLVRLTRNGFRDDLPEIAAPGLDC